MTDQMTFSEACTELAVVIKGSPQYCDELHGHIISEFIQGIEAGETSKMALVLAKQSVEATAIAVLDGLDNIRRHSGSQE